MENPLNTPPVIATWPREAWKPVSSTERLPTLDVLRGFALLGIFIVNMAGFSAPAGEVLSFQIWKSGVDRVADFIARFLAEGKFYPLFAFLFGLGAAIQMERAESVGASFGGRFSRRLFVLLGFGLVHAFLIWEGDILTWYALCGFLLLLFRRRQPMTLLIWAGVCLLIPVLLTLLIWMLIAVASLFPQAASEIQNAFASDAASAEQAIDDSIRTFAHGTIGEIFRARAMNVFYFWMVGILFIPTFFAMFLIGLWAGRKRLAQDVEQNLPFIRRVLWWGLACGLPANLLYAVSEYWNEPDNYYAMMFFGSALLGLGGPAQALAYAAGITLILRRDTWKKLLNPIAMAGRMALTNYLLQSIICTLIFYSYGLGLYGSVGRATGIVLAVGIYIAEVVFSIAWLQKFRFGPAEWLWRSLTYGKCQPMRNRG